MKFRLLCAAVMVCFFTAGGFAKIYRLTDGSIVDGKIVSSNENGYIIADERGGVKNVPYSMISVETNLTANAKPAAVEAVPAESSAEPKNLFGVTGGAVMISSIVIPSFNINYEYLLNKNISIGAAYGLMIASGGTLGTFAANFMIHPLGHSNFDLFFGMGLSSSSILGSQSASKTTYIDLPLTLGFNVWLNKNFALRIQDRIFLLSLGTGMNEINGGFEVAF